MLPSFTQTVLVLAFLMQSALSFSQNFDCAPPTFFKTLGNPDPSEIGVALAHSGDGNLYLVGQVNSGSQTFIQKINLAGEPVWTRSFDVDPLKPLKSIQVFVDSEGMIAGAGTQEYGAGEGRRGFAFRYDPVANSFLWARSIASKAPTGAGILEKTPGGNFIFYQNPNTDYDLMFIDYEIEILELDRTTGNIVPGFAKRYGYLYQDALEKMVMVNGSLYGFGSATCRSDFGFKSNRLLLVRFDPTDGTPIWAQLSHADTTSVADFNAHDFAVDGDALVAAYTMSEDASNWPGNIEPYLFHLQKTDLDGNIIWVRKYDLQSSLANLRLLVVPDGYVLTTQGIVVKLNKNGNFLWGRTLPPPFPGVDIGFYGPQHAVFEADSLYFTGGTRTGSIFVSSYDGFLWKMLADGSMGDSCGYITPFYLDAIDVQNFVTTPITLEYFASPAVSFAENAAWLQDTMAEEILCPQYAPMSLTCPADIEVSVGPGTGSIPVSYNGPAGTSDCDCPGFEFTLSTGLSSGSLFPVGNTQVCFSAQDDCGLSANCCFNVKVHEDEEMPCDTKTIGCLQYDLLDITADAKQRRTYRIRVTNNCAAKMIYTAFQLPNGVTAKNPPDNSVFTSPAGREYDVRNPNFSPFYSIRFKSATDGISNGESDVFEYTLPAQSQPAFIHVTSRLDPQLFYEAHLNTFDCPIGAAPAQNRGGSATVYENARADILLFPNPTNGELFADLSRWQDRDLNIRILDGRGAQVLKLQLNGGSAAQSIPLGSQLPAGLYFLEIASGQGERGVRRFVLER